MQCNMTKIWSDFHQVASCRVASHSVKYNRGSFRIAVLDFNLVAPIRMTSAYHKIILRVTVS